MALKIFSSGMKKLMKKSTPKNENPGLSNLRTQSYILKENRQRGYPLGDLPSAASEISKATTKYGGQGIVLKKGMTMSSGKKRGLFFAKRKGGLKGKGINVLKYQHVKPTYGSGLQKKGKK